MLHLRFIQDLYISYVTIKFKNAKLNQSTYIYLNNNIIFIEIVG